MSVKQQWIAWILLSVMLASYFVVSLTWHESPVSRTFLPGPTTAGHYQIELKCRDCHTPAMGVQQDSCVRCHGEELRLAKDTHPEKKFRDPSNAALLDALDARTCTTCHEEHVPERTGSMGVSLPGDYCYQCHADIADDRPSHEDLAFDSCAAAGCHNFHDNRALFENHLATHFGEPELLDEPVVPTRALEDRLQELRAAGVVALTAGDADAPAEATQHSTLVADWAGTVHARAGVNCTACHVNDMAAGGDQRGDGASEWTDAVDFRVCQECHESETTGFLAGRHGMRLAAGLPPMEPAQARLPMHADAAHEPLTCNACHGAHRFDTQFAAATACVQCHADEHTAAYEGTAHHDLWLAELAGDGQPGTGVSCATCHMPRRDVAEEGEVVVQHNQNDNLRPNEKMAASVCQSCHGLQFTLDALADEELVERNFDASPSVHVRSVDMAHEWINRNR